MTENVAVPAARVRSHGEWHLVTCGTWEISVAPDGMIMLPRHMHPRDFADFVACGKVAVDVSNRIIAENEAKAQARGLPGRRAIVNPGAPPPGAVRMRTTTAQQRASSIGRRNKGAAAANPPPHKRVSDG